MKKILMFSLTLLSLTMLTSFYVNADINNVKGVNLVKTQEDETLFGDISYKHEKISSAYVGSSNYQESDVYSYTVGGDNKTVKIATWSLASKYKTTLTTLTEIAKDYEANHPGWMVVGGINSEGWHTNSGENEISNMYVQDGDIIRSGVSSEQFKELIGFYDDRSHIIKRYPDMTENLVLSIYDDQDAIKYSYPVKSYNKLPGDNDVALIAGSITGDKDISDYYCFEGSYSMYRPATFYISGTYASPKNDLKDGVLVKGKIEKKTTEPQFNSSVRFYLVTKNEEVANKLIDGTKIRCQYEFTDEFKNTPSVTGYMFKLIENSHVMLPTDIEDNTDDFNNGYTLMNDSFQYGAHDYYKTSGKQRSSIGFKDDGSIVLLTANNSNGGPSQYELGNILLSKGCTNAYQFDGGGSVTFIKRNNIGGFDVINDCQYGSARSIATGIFFVTYNPEINFVSSTRNSMKVSYNDSLIKNVVAHIGDKSYPLAESNNEITGLEEGTTYDVSFSYDIISYLDNNKYVASKSSKIKYSTLSYVVPGPGLSYTNITKTGIKIVKEKNSISDNIFDVIVHIGDNSYQMGDNYSFDINDLRMDTNYVISYSYKVKDPETNKIYDGRTENKNFKTNKYDLPEITNFSIKSPLKDGKITFDYEYTDPDDIVTNAYIKCNGQVVQLNIKSGSKRISDITADTDACLVITYTSEDGKNVKLESDKFVIQVQKEETPQEENKKGCSCKRNNILISFYSLFCLASLARLFFKKR